MASVFVTGGWACRANILESEVPTGSKDKALPLVHKETSAIGSSALALSAANVATNFIEELVGKVMEEIRAVALS
jgi:hypothetical protein